MRAKTSGKFSVDSAGEVAGMEPLSLKGIWLC
jgi:hypothetical protein